MKSISPSPTVRFKGGKGKSTVNVSKLRIFYKGKSIFRFNNGDIYVGGFKAVFPSTITRHGYGMYISEDDKTVYLGHWYRDKMYHGRVKYSNGITYIGNLKRSKYHGKGNYRVPGLGNIISNYLHNLPTAEVVLVDVNGFYWTGSVNDGGGVQLYPVNPFHNDPSWHENTSEISESKIRPDPIKFQIPVSRTAPEISLKDVDLPLLRSLHDESYFNTFF